MGIVSEGDRAGVEGEYRDVSGGVDKISLVVVGGVAAVFPFVSLDVVIELVL